MVRREAIAVALLCIACDKPARQPTASTRAQPQVRATVVTLQTSLQPSNKTLRHQIVIANGRARSMDEVDRWRLVDLSRDNVTFVDDIARSYRTESLASLLTRRRAAMAEPLPRHAARAEFISTGARRVLHNVTAAQSLIRAGAYQRELWVADHPALPPNLFAVLHVSQPLRSSFAPMMKAVDDDLIAIRGFPLADRAELPYGKGKMVIERTVVGIEQRDVPAAWLNVNARYTEIRAPGAGRPPASLRLPRRRTPAAGSQSSATGQKTP